jgi:hypothetical protein
MLFSAHLMVLAAFVFLVLCVHGTSTEFTQQNAAISLNSSWSQTKSAGQTLRASVALEVQWESISSIGYHHETTKFLGNYVGYPIYVSLRSQLKRFYLTQTKLKHSCISQQYQALQFTILPWKSHKYSLVPWTSSWNPDANVPRLIISGDQKNGFSLKFPKDATEFSCGFHPSYGALWRLEYANALNDATFSLDTIKKVEVTKLVPISQFPIRSLSLENMKNSSTLMTLPRGNDVKDKIAFSLISPLLELLPPYRYPLHYTISAWIPILIHEKVEWKFLSDLQLQNVYEIPINGFETDSTMIWLPPRSQRQVNLNTFRKQLRVPWKGSLKRSNHYLETIQGYLIVEIPTYEWVVLPELATNLGAPTESTQIPSFYSEKIFASPVFQSRISYKPVEGRDAYSRHLSTAEVNMGLPFSLRRKGHQGRAFQELLAVSITLKGSPQIQHSRERSYFVRTAMNNQYTLTSIDPHRAEFQTEMVVGQHGVPAFRILSKPTLGWLTPVISNSRSWYVTKIKYDWHNATRIPVLENKSKHLDVKKPPQLLSLDHGLDNTYHLPHSIPIPIEFQFKIDTMPHEWAQLLKFSSFLIPISPGKSITVEGESWGAQLLHRINLSLISIVPRKPMDFDAKFGFLNSIEYVREIVPFSAEINVPGLARQLHGQFIISYPREYEWVPEAHFVKM